MNSHRCPVCGKTYKRGSYLRAHVAREHGARLRATWVGRAGRLETARARCATCALCFADWEQFVQHRAAAHGARHGARPEQLVVSRRMRGLADLSRDAVDRRPAETPARLRCVRCGIRLSRDLMRAHVLLHLDAEDLDRLGVARHRCPSCPFVSDGAKAMRSHLGLEHPWLFAESH